MGYELVEHRHKFSVWAAARAAQRAFTSVEYLRQALESIDIYTFVGESNSKWYDSAQYDVIHRRWCNSIVEFLSEKGIQNATFGRAAKLVAVYIKSMVICNCDNKSNLSVVAYPPIDRILLQNLADSPSFKSTDRDLWRMTSWTTLDEASYDRLIKTLRTVVSEPDPWWKIEEYWTVTNE